MRNSLNLFQTDGGTRIKQGDISTRFEFELNDEYYKIVEGLGGSKATIKLSKDGVIAFRTTSTVADGKVAFKIPQPLEVGIYDLEIETDGYVFPSDNSIKIEVFASTENYQIKELVPVDYAKLSESIEELQEIVSKGGSVPIPSAETGLDPLAAYNLAKI